MSAEAHQCLCLCREAGGCLCNFVREDEEQFCMAILLCDLVRDMELADAAVKVAESHQDEAKTRLLNALALIGNPLKVGGSVVIGDKLIKRPYETLPLVMTPIVNVPSDLVVVGEPNLNPHSDLAVI